MTLQIRNITLKNFRSYSSASLELDPVLTIIFGPNAAGKTNIIEALQLTTEGLSFRNPRWEETVNQQENKKTKNLNGKQQASGLPSILLSGAKVAINAEGGGLLREVTMKIIEGRRSYEVNGKRVRGSKEIAGAIPCVVFTPEDLALIKASSETRRTEIDNLGSQLSKKYSLLLSEYKKVLQHRNRLLKEERVYDTVFDVITDQITTLGAVLLEQRLTLLARVIPLFIEAYSRIGGEENLEVGYKNTLEGQPVWKLEEIKSVLEKNKRNFKIKLGELLDAKKVEDVARKSTTVGPHRDDLVFYIDGKDARVFGSQGQQRSVVLAWKIAEIFLIEEMTGKKPLLLLDDVMSELDEGRRKALTGLIGTMGQTVITTAHIGYFDKDIVKKAKVVDVTTLEKGNDEPTI